MSSTAHPQGDLYSAVDIGPSSKHCFDPGWGAGGDTDGDRTNGGRKALNLTSERTSCPGDFQGKLRISLWGEMQLFSLDRKTSPSRTKGKTSWEEERQGGGREGWREGAGASPSLMRPWSSPDKSHPGLSPLQCAHPPR